MAATVLLYRVFRLRRLILAAALLPALVVLALTAAKGPFALVLLAPALGAPALHALRFPNAWTETLAVSLVVSVLLALAGTIGAGLDLGALALRLSGIAALGMALFVVAGPAISALMARGPARQATERARRRTRLSPDEAKARITLRPGREDSRTSCGPADADGVFPVTIRHRVPNPSGGGERAADVLLFAEVIASPEGAHEVMWVEAGPADPAAAPLAEMSGAGEGEEEETPPAVSVTRHAFRAGRRGTVVEMVETGGALPAGEAFGAWLSDAAADRLTDEIDRAEGRAERANRFATRERMLSGRVRPFARRRAAATPAE